MFKIMGTVLTEKRAPEEDIQKISPYIFRRWLSNDPRTIRAVNIFNIFSKVPIEAQYDCMQQSFGGKIKYLGWPKNIKDTSAEIEMIQKFYNISQERAKEYLEFLTADDIKAIQEELEDLNPRQDKPKVQKLKGKK